jgi:hypothetical protein
VLEGVGGNAEFDQAAVQVLSVCGQGRCQLQNRRRQRVGVALLTEGLRAEQQGRWPMHKSAGRRSHGPLARPPGKASMCRQCAHRRSTLLGSLLRAVRSIALF